MSDEHSTLSSRRSAAIERQIEYEPTKKTYTSRCAVCGKAETMKKPLFYTHLWVIDKLRLNYNYCDVCDKWVCGDCFLTDCAKERGVTGLTCAQFEEAWPEIRRRIWVRSQAVEQKYEKRTLEQGAL